MDIRAITRGDELWGAVCAYARDCSWRAGKSLARSMEGDGFHDWERVFVALNGDAIAGYCTVGKKDCIPEVEYTPYIGFVFVGEPYRGHRLSHALILQASAYLKELGFDRTYLVSDHKNLYEKYGFVIVDRKMAPWGNEQKIYMRTL